VKRKIPCFCESTFEVEVIEEIDLDNNKEYLEEIQDGSFLNFTCPSCGKKLKPEFPISVHWPSMNFRFEIIPELDRGEFYRRKEPPRDKDLNTMETIIGYPEMADRLAVIRDGFDPVPVEAIKYFLQIKAEEQYPDQETDIWYFRRADDFLEFHIHGIKQNEIAVMKVPLSLYEKTLDDYHKNPTKELFTSLRVRSYLSVKNTMRHEALK
jgi:hypothetical protein